MGKIKLEKKDKVVNTKNYLIVLLVSFLTIILCIITRNIVLNYKQSLTNNNLFKEKLQSINLNELDYAIPELSEGFLYISYTGNSEVTTMEKKLYKIIEKKDIADKVIYLDVSGYKSEDYIEILRKKFSNIKDQINEAPVIVYIKDGKAIEAVSSELDLLDYKALNELCKKYEVE